MIKNYLFESKNIFQHLKDSLWQLLEEGRLVSNEGKLQRKTLLTSATIYAHHHHYCDQWSLTTQL